MAAQIDLNTEGGPQCWSNEISQASLSNWTPNHRHILMETKYLWEIDNNREAFSETTVSQASRRDLGVRSLQLTHSFAHKLGKRKTDNDREALCAITVRQAS